MTRAERFVSSRLRGKVEKTPPHGQAALSR
jgi:hypothetical protein